MKSFARATRLPNISGRSDYIADPERQECIVAASAKVDWSEYVEYERYNQKNEQRNNEGREMVIQLPNEWAELPQAELRRRGDLLAQTVAGTNHERQWAMHWNKDRTNLHIHVIFSERERIKEPGVWDRNIYLSKDNKVARRKCDRMTDEDGNYILIHRKGEAKEPFSAKEPKFSSRKWLHEVKAEIRSKLEDLGVKFERDNWLPQHHQGKGKDSADIARRNGIIMENNRRLDCLHANGLPIDDLVKQAKSVRFNSRITPGETFIPIIYYDAKAKEFRVDDCLDTDAAVKRIDQTKDFYEKVTEFIAAKEEKEASPEKPAPAEPVQQPQKDAPAAPAGEMEREIHPAAPAAPEAIQKPSEKLRAAFSDLQEAQAQLSSAQTALSQANAMWGWGKKKKEARAEAGRDLVAAQEKCQDAFDRVVSHGVSIYRDGVKLTATNLDRDDLNYLERRVDWRINEMERSEAHAAKPSLAENISEAMKRYREHQKEIAPAVEARMKEKSKSQSKGGPER